MTCAAPALLAVASAACVSSTLRGRVTDCRDSSPLEGADVQLTTQAQGVEWIAQQTGSDGAYAFKVDDKSVMPITLTAVKGGYQSVQKTYDSMPNAGQDVCLRPTKR
jgi:hypothetical protein